MGAATNLNAPRKTHYKSFARLRRVQKQARKSYRPAKKITITDAHLMSKQELKKKIKNPRSNLSLSGKKKRKINNQLRRAENIKSKMDCSGAVKPAKKTKKVANTSNNVEEEDVVMKDME